MKISIKLLPLIAALFTLSACSDDEEEIVQETPVETVTFSYEQGVFSGTALPYRKAAISQQPGEKAVLAIYLHGGSSKGSDNETQMGEAAIDSISGFLSQNKINSIMLVPQCPKDKSWGGAMNIVLKSLIDKYVAEGNVDTDRIYIFGGSMGGTGTWSMLSVFPSMFAAAMPVAGDPSGVNVENVSTTPVFTVMGTDDQIMDISKVSDVMTQLAALGADNIFETEEGWTHEMTCVQSYTKGRLAWVFSHSKQ